MPSQTRISFASSPEQLEQIESFRAERGIKGTSEAVRSLVEAGLKASRGGNGGFLSAQALELAEIFDKLDDQGRDLLRRAADLILKLEMALEQAEEPEKPAASLVKVAARNNPGDPIQEENIIPFMVEQVRQSDEEL